MSVPNITAHEAALTALVPESARADYAVRVQALIARNAVLEAVEKARKDAHITKKELARRAGLDPSVVRRMLTSKTANPTAENVFRLFAASGISLDAVLPSGDHVSLMDRTKAA
jgi:ribosome-binding protein aMBF1 (putative translation factor)